MDPRRSASESLFLALLVASSLVASSCASGLGGEALQRVAAIDQATASPVTQTSMPPTTASTAPTRSAALPAEIIAPPVAPTVAPAVVPPEPVPPLGPPSARSITEQAWTPFATVGGVTLVHPAARVERVGFHQANHDGARQLDVLATAVSPVTLEGRSRATSSRSAADVVVDPASEIRSAVTGRVKRAGTYVLYCEYSDDFLVVEPDQQPGWEVKMLHIDGVRARPGDRVVAGETVVAGRATQLPFESQVDKVGGFDPAWPHVHIEVIDLAIPNVPSPGGGCK